MTALQQFPAPADVASFHAWNGLPPRLPGPVELTDAERAELATLPDGHRATRLIEMVRDDFTRRFPVIGTFGSVDGHAQARAWREFGDAYIAAAIEQVWPRNHAIRAGMGEG